MFNEAVVVTMATSVSYNDIWKFDSHMHGQVYRMQLFVMTFVSYL